MQQNLIPEEKNLYLHPTLSFKDIFFHCLKFCICYYIYTFHDAHNTCDIINTWQAKHMHEKASTMCNKYMWHMHAGHFLSYNEIQFSEECTKTFLTVLSWDNFYNFPKITLHIA